MRWLIVEEALRNRKGHWFEAIMTFQKGFRAKGDEVVVLGDRDMDADIRETLGAVPMLPKSIWHLTGEGAGRLKRYSRVFTHAWKTWRAMRGYLKANPDYDAIFVPTVGLHHLLAWVWLIKGMLRRRQTRVLLFFIMIPAVWDSESEKPRTDGSPTAWLLFRLLNSLGPEIKSGKVILGAETEATRAALETLAGVPATLFPQIVVPLPAEETPEGPGEGIMMGCYGPPRAEKGSDVLQDAIAIYRRRFPGSRTRFTIHWTQDYVVDGTHKITKSPELLRDPQVKYLVNYFAHGEYERQVQRTQVMLLPYRLSSYRLRGSRVIMEAMVNGIPVIATGGTTLAGALETFGAGLICEDGRPESLAQAIQEMETRYEELSRAAQARRQAAATEFSVENFRKTFLRSGQSS